MVRAAPSAVLATAVSLLMGCNMPDALPIVGAWSKTDTLVNETWVFTNSSASVADRNVSAITGTMSSSIQSISVRDSHLQMTTMSTSGIYAQVPAGTVWYVTWSVSGDTLFLSGSVLGYPGTATSGPFTKVH